MFLAPGLLVFLGIRPPGRVCGERDPLALSPAGLAFCRKGAAVGGFPLLLRARSFLSQAQKPKNPHVSLIHYSVPISVHWLYFGLQSLEV